jgi:hypothetical protein
MHAIACNRMRPSRPNPAQPLSTPQPRPCKPPTTKTRCSRGFPGTPLIAGSRNTLAIDAEGQLWSWGWNDRGTLGHGHRQMERKPRRVQGLKGVKIVQVGRGGARGVEGGARAVRYLGGNEGLQRVRRESRQIAYERCLFRTAVRHPLAV